MNMGKAYVPLSTPPNPLDGLTKWTPHFQKRRTQKNNARRRSSRQPGPRSAQVQKAVNGAKATQCPKVAMKGFKHTQPGYTGSTKEQYPERQRPSMSPPPTATFSERRLWELKEMDYALLEHRGGKNPYVTNARSLVVHKQYSHPRVSTSRISVVTDATDKIWALRGQRPLWLTDQLLEDAEKARCALQAALKLEGSKRGDFGCCQYGYSFGGGPVRSTCYYGEGVLAHNLNLIDSPLQCPQRQSRRREKGLGCVSKQLLRREGDGVRGQ